MHQAIPYRTWLSSGPRDTSRDHHGPSTGTAAAAASNGVDPTNVGTMVRENAVIVIGRRGCCMCHVVKRLLQGLGVNSPVHEVDADDEATVLGELSRQVGGASGGDGGGEVQFPAVFVGGKLFGGLERVMATHISGELVPILKDAGALWL